MCEKKNTVRDCRTKTIALNTVAHHCSAHFITKYDSTPTFPVSKYQYNQTESSQLSVNWGKS